MPTTWIDLTTTRALRGRGPVGITRVERALAQAAASAFGEQLRFLHYDRYEEVWLELPRARGSDLLTAPASMVRSGHGVQAKRNPLAMLARRLEHQARPHLRRLAAAVQRLAGRAPKPAVFAPGDSIVLLGDTATLRGLGQLIEAKRRSGCRLVAMCYDLIPWRLPHFFASIAAVERFCDNVAALLPHSDRILVPSHATAADLAAFARHRNLPSPPIDVIALGSDAASTVSPRRPDWADAIPPAGFVVCVGTVQVRKNHRLLYNIWRRLAERAIPDIPLLVLAGDAGWATGDVRSLIKRDPLTTGRIRMTGAVDDGELAWLYRHCRFSVYPSLYEGWGLPVAEGLRAGRPCIASASSSIPEAGAGLATVIDPLDFAAWYDAVLQHITDAAFVSDRVAQIAAAPPLPDWTAAAAQFIALLKQTAAAAR